MYRIFFTELECFADARFDTVAEALAYAESLGFEATAHDWNGGCCASWTPFGGTTYYDYFYNH